MSYNIYGFVVSAGCTMIPIDLSRQRHDLSCYRNCKEIKCTDSIDLPRMLKITLTPLRDFQLDVSGINWLLIYYRHSLNEVCGNYSV